MKSSNFKFIIAFVGVALSSSGLANRFEVANVSAVITAANKIVIQSMARISAGNSSGSGVFVSPYHVLTAAHVIAPMDCDEMKIQTMIEPGSPPKPKGRSLYCDDIVFMDAELDIALVVTDRAVRDYLHLPNIDIISDKQDITSMGYTTSGHLGRSDECIVTNKRGSETISSPNGNFDLRKMFMTDCLLSPGMSGGPVLDLSEAGRPRVIGVNSLIVNKVFPGATVTAMGRLIDASIKYKDDFTELYRNAGERWKKVEP